MYKQLKEDSDVLTLCISSECPGDCAPFMVHRRMQPFSHNSLVNYTEFAVEEFNLQTGKYS